MPNPNRPPTDRYRSFMVPENQQTDEVAAAGTGWGAAYQENMNAARNAVAALRAGVANLSTPAGKRAFIDKIGEIGRSMDGILQARNNEQGIQEVHTKMIPIIIGAAQNVNSGNIDPTNVNEDINKIEEHMNEIGRKANVGGRKRRNKKTRASRKGKKRMTRRRR